MLCCVALRTKEYDVTDQEPMSFQLSRERRSPGGIPNSTPGTPVYPATAPQNPSQPSNPNPYPASTFKRPRNRIGKGVGAALNAQLETPERSAGDIPTYANSIFVQYLHSLRVIQTSCNSNMCFLIVSLKFGNNVLAKNMDIMIVIQYECSIWEC